jgi:DNA-binding response OmpR family regulator
MLFTRTVDVHVGTLRKKIEAQAARPQFILTLHGIGYKFVG